MIARIERIQLAAQEDLAEFRRAVLRAAEELGLRAVERTKLVTAASELGRNCVIHGGGGHAEVRLLEEGGRRGIEFEVTDDGPGIDDLDQAFTDGWSSKRGLGLGLGGARRLLAGEMEIETTPGGGTRVRGWRWT